ncbi:hypothetical protein Cgig2_031368 [Carnegiea gigantea]|uniref:Reverse transcriptase zinc-binding domain-containing protein n=1 Tax=Carnegiea gigantea TaxID=171969 RepID=A0A9Q1GI79_9CARY|nr:hypothetical protein Cgig2_031368 [Carnegiea gigantea]
MTQILRKHDFSFQVTSLHGLMDSIVAFRRQDWWKYTPKSDTSWYCKKLQRVKERFKTYPTEEYKVKEGYIWLLQDSNTPHWGKLIWSRLSIPRHSFTAWIFMHQKLPVLHRIGRFTHLQFTDCKMCQQSTETQEHQFFECKYAKDNWSLLLTEWDVKVQLNGMEAYIRSLTKLQTPRKLRRLIHAVAKVVIYHIWLTRNIILLKNKVYPVQEILKEIKG